MFFKEKNVKKGAVLITGSSSGIGAACVKMLNEQGFWVFAGLRDMAKAEPLLSQASNQQSITPILLDVTKLDLIDEAVRQVNETLTTEETSFIGIVNNHTSEHHGPLEILPLEIIQQEMEVDYFGTLNVVKAFLPLLRKHQGRIVTFSSVNGRCVFRSIGASCAAKYPMVGYVRCLVFRASTLEYSRCKRWTWGGGYPTVGQSARSL